jgi:hypothetical protein
MNDEWERIWKEGVMAQFKILFWHLHGETEEYHKKSVRIASIQAEI